VNDETLASDTEREQAVARLRHASAEGRLTLEELTARTDAAYSARTHGELVRVTADLPAAAEAPAQPRGAERRIGVGLFVPVGVDLRRPRAAARSVFTLGLFAPVVVTVPAGADVDMRVFGLFAPARETGAASDPAPGAPVVRVRGLALFAPVVVRHERS
jgi:hypothetical protein